MKKIILLISIFALCADSFSQIRVDTLGNVSIGEVHSSYQRLYVSGTGKDYGARFKNGKSQIHVYNYTKGVSGNARKGIYILNVLDSVQTSGIDVYSQSSGSGRIYGIKSVGGNSTSFSCGVHGGIDGSQITCGSGIIGSSGSGANLIFGQYSGRYAGFFQGDVRVTGTLYAGVLTPTLTGNISGGMDNVSVQVVSRDADMTDDGVSDKLNQVSLLKFVDNTDMTKTEVDTSGSYESETYSQLISKIKDGEDLTDEEMELLEKERQAKEEMEANTDVPQAKMASVRYGLAAEQLKNVFPELVYEDNNGNVSINYIEMVPLLVQSINELKADIKELREENASLRAELSGDNVTIKSRADATSITTAEEPADILSLSQNDPNPFSDRTTITVNIPEGVTTAAVFFYDMSGKQVDKRIITERGQSQLSVTSSDMTEGMYLYSLIADGKVISTRKMILTK